MPIRKFPGVPTLGGAVMWEDLANEKGWRIQYNEFIQGRSRRLYAYRLLDPKNNLWASASDLEELEAAMPALVEKFDLARPFSIADAATLIAIAIKIAKTLKGHR